LNAGAGKIMGGFLKITVLCIKRSTLVAEKFTLEQTMKFKKGSRVIAVLFPLISAVDRGWEWPSTPRPGRFTRRKDLVPIL
jgi:hypothetical protein